MWGVQLRNLGGTNNIRFGPETYYEDGREVPDSRGNKYFDHKWDLPEDAQEVSNKQRSEGNSLS